MSDLPEALVAAIESGELTQAQLRQLITLEARELGLSFDEAVTRARAMTLPRSLIGSDIDFLVELLSPDVVTLS